MTNFASSPRVEITVFQGNKKLSNKTSIQCWKSLKIIDLSRWTAIFY